MIQVPTLELDERFRVAAAAEGLLDVAYDVFDDTAIGPLLVGVTDRGVCRITFDPEPERELERLARAYGPRVLRSSRPVERVHRELDEYLAGRRHTFDVDVDLRAQPEFYLRVLAELAQVAYGETTTYGALAARAGNPRAARAVGTVMNRNPVPIVLPCPPSRRRQRQPDRLRRRSPPQGTTSPARRRNSPSLPPSQSPNGRSQRKALAEAAPAHGDGEAATARANQTTANASKSSAAPPPSAPAKREPPQPGSAQHFPATSYPSGRR